MPEPADILTLALQRAVANLQRPIVTNSGIRQRAEYVSRNLRNRAGVRLLTSCLLAKIHNPAFDVRKPYTQIGGTDSFSGRTYDEQYITAFINTHNLPCNNTTAFLTSAFRCHNAPLTRDLNLVGRPPQLYTAVLQLLDDVHNNRVSADELLAETIRLLITFKNERQQRIESLVATLKTTADAISLSSEDIVSLIDRHMRSKGTSRLPVLIIAAAYNAAKHHLGEQTLALQSHNAADKQTGALGDVEITLIGDDRIVTSYEMKNKRVTDKDIERALQKLSLLKKRVDNYIFITTEEIDRAAQEYARSLYVQTGGVEFVILDCVGFVRHYLHLFHRLRPDFLQEYQSLILAEPESSVSHPVKESFLSLRQVAEADLN